MSSALDCPVGCESTTLGSNFNDCTMTISWGEIQGIAVASNDFAGFTDITDTAEWAANIASDDIEVLTVKGTMGEPEREEYQAPKGKTIYGRPSFDVPFEIWDLTDENWEMMRKTYCNSSFKVWLITKSYVFGGNSGINDATFKMFPLIEEGENSINRISGNLKWKGEAPPTRSAVPSVLS